MKTWNELAKCYVIKKDYNKAIHAYKELLRINPHDLEAWNELAYSSIKMHNYEDAINATLRALTIDKRNKLALKNLEMIYKIKGKSDRNFNQKLYIHILVNSDEEQDYILDRMKTVRRTKASYTKKKIQ